MKRILSIQSFVASGTVGNSVAAFALQRLGFEVVAVPTVFFSNHPGRGRIGGLRLDPDQLDGFLKALAENKWFGTIDGILTGYLGAAAHAGIIASYIRALKNANRDLIYCCDPVCGDAHTGLFVAPDIPQAIKAELLPLADMATPNHFELGHLTGSALATPSDVGTARQSLGIERLLCTSFPFSDTQIGEVLATGDGEFEQRTGRIDNVPHGAGDLMSALFLGHTLSGLGPQRALARANTIVAKILTASKGAPDLNIVGMQQLFTVHPETSQDA